MSFRLLETMRFAPDGGLLLFERHMRRLSDSARYFSFQCDMSELRRAVLDRASAILEPSWLRLTLAHDGEYNLDSGPLETRNPKWLRLSSFRVNSSNRFLYHKTTNRDIYDAARREGDADTEVLLVNEREEITEITIANVALFRQGQWTTPQLSCGLLNGVMRRTIGDRSSRRRSHTCR